MRTLAVLTIVGLAAGCTSMSTQTLSEVLTIDYLNFNALTFRPVTADNIECNAERTWTFSENGPLLSQFYASVEATRPFDESAVRARIVTSAGTVYVDANGVARGEGGFWTMDKPEFQRYLSQVIVLSTANDAPCPGDH